MVSFSFDMLLAFFLAQNSVRDKDVLSWIATNDPVIPFLEDLWALGQSFYVRMLINKSG